MVKRRAIILLQTFRTTAEAMHREKMISTSGPCQKDFCAPAPTQRKGTIVYRKNVTRVHRTGTLASIWLMKHGAMDAKSSVISFFVYWVLHL